MANALLDKGVAAVVFDSNGRTPSKTAVDAGSNLATSELARRTCRRTGLPGKIPSLHLFHPDHSGQTPFHSPFENAYKTMNGVLYRAGSDINKEATVDEATQVS